jgi:hypothetical protein
MKFNIGKVSLTLLAFGLLLQAAGLLRAETPTFRQVRVTATGPIHDMIVVDLNKDGYPDIAIIDNSSKLIRTFLGNASYTYLQAFTKAHTKIGKKFVGPGDFNGDKVPDLAVDMPSTKTYFVVFPGKGDGSLLSAVNVGTGTSQNGFDQAAVLDFNNDGKPDVIGFQKYGGPLLSFLNLGKTKFKTTKIQNACNYDSVTTGDFDTDKYDDAVFGELLNTDSVYYLKSNKNGTFLAPKATKVGSIGTFLTCGDLNGDHKLDLVGDGNYGNDAWSMLGRGDGRFIKKKMLGGDASMGGGGILANLTQDTKLDFASGEVDGIALYQGLGTGAFTALAPLAKHLRFDREPEAVAAADVNGDGRLDLIGAQWSSGVKWNDDSDDMSNIILFLNGQTPNTLAISNLVTTKLAFEGAVVKFAGSVQFQSTSGDLKFINTTEVTDNAYMDFRVTLDFPSPLSDYTYHYFATGTYLHKPGETAGTVSWDIVLPTTVITNATPTVTLKNFYLLDYNLVQSNGLLTTTPRPGRSLRTAQAAPGLGKVLHSGRDGIAALVGVEIK